jgi:acetate kinase
MSGSVLVVNPGSSSLKVSVVTPDGSTALQADVDAPDGSLDETALRGLLDEAPEADAAGVRVVHGGADFSSSVLVDDAVIARIDALASLAPLHNPLAVRAMRVLAEHSPQRPVVACFDSAFHAGMPAAAATYAIPWEWTQQWRIRRYGFHGLSHAYACRRAADMLDRPLASLGIVSCHLGAGASLAAIQGGRSVDTTMGFTPLEGLVMATRSGSLDPGILFWLEREQHIPSAALERALDHESGLLGISGVSADMRDVIAAAARGDARASLALDVYNHRLQGEIARMAVALDRFDALVFTGGVGERDPGVRARTCEALGLLGLPATVSEPPENADAVVSAEGSTVSVLVVYAREDLEIDREVRGLLWRATG